ncbi:Hydroxyacylglutathione hydrolase [Paenibacillus sp. JJ-100]|uniref:MBL fold metallo-hydrolase n=1 Tax=Paenibacillus sp. JJ-100 TaxID=2974896 RepID=UPI0022FF60B7|nr:MBL fold metallo-hydrolase [Paenibacillus sp. JJ-100]CAI6082957.1 Hydroxyacylglutathione hydrolase [Paenibacillus sp. JJ-100]
MKRTRAEQLTMPEGMHRIQITMSFPLRWVNSYILTEPDGKVTLVDPGPRTAETEQEWRDALEGLGLTLQDIHQIVLTHHHPDHLGLSGWMQQMSGVPVLMSARSQEEADYMWGPGAIIAERLPEYYRTHGMPEYKTVEIKEHMHTFISQITPLPEVTHIADGDQLQMGGKTWIAVETGGHAPGHLSFYAPESREILCGDAVLPQISPNVSLQPGSDPEPLLSYMDGLTRLNKLTVERAYPGHRNPFTRFTERTAELLAHHEERLAKLSERLQDSPAHAYDICLHLFGERLGTHQLRFAMSETLAHLQELIRRDLARQVQQPDGIIYFQYHQ